MAHIKIIVYNKLPRFLKDQIDRFDQVCFPWIYQSEKRINEHRDKFSPSLKDQIGHVCALDKNSLVGRVVIMKRKITFENKPVILGGVAGVCISPEKRKLGLATKLLDRAIKELKLTGCDIAYLCTDVEDKGYLKLYGRFGFKVLGRLQTYLGKSGKRYIDHDAMIAPINSKTIFDLVISEKENLDIGSGNW